ncbi:MAG: M20/M25/M40 family metallo-hydrolase [Anaerolineales bacterium]|nr:M20/M25/M40 family metallo-hydrolase [Anaerolineales bacterium]
MTNFAFYAQSPAALLQKLIQFDTTNPPGNEIACVSFIGDLLTQAGIPFQTFARTPERPNLIARLPGQGRAAPLLLYGHVDVVTTENQRWTHPPFEAKIADGMIWGRGALDMKGGVAMMVAAFLRAAEQAKTHPLPGDVVLTILSDEEAGGDYGAKFLVETHAEQFAGIKYAIGEFGGFSLTIGGKRFYPIQVSEKQICWIKASVRGMGGHGSAPVRGQAMARLATLLRNLDQIPLPIHITPTAKAMFEAMGAAMGSLSGWMIAQLANPTLAGPVLSILGTRGLTFGPLVRHTVSPTILHGSSKINVIPNEVSVELDGRMLPGFKPDEMLAELRAVVGDGVTLEVVRHDPGPRDPDMGWFDTLAGILREADPTGVPVPLLLSGVTDGRYFSQLGIQTYGFLPMPLPSDFNFTGMIHGPDERVSVDAMEFGTRAIGVALERAK